MSAAAGPASSEEVVRQLTFQSFAYSFGVPRDLSSENVFDIRKYSSPSRELCQTCDGTAKRLQNDILQRQEYVELIQTILQRAIECCKSTTDEDDVVIGIGCEEGRHRSVAVVEEVTKQFSALKLEGIEVNHPSHRDIARRQERMKRDKDIRSARSRKYDQHDDDD